MNRRGGETVAGHLETLHSRLMIQYVRGKSLYASEDHWVFRSDDEGRRWQKLCRLEPRQRQPLALFKDTVLRTGLVRGWRRNIGLHNVVVLPSGTVLVQYDGIYRFDGTGRTARFVFGLRQDRLYGPLKNGFVVDDSSGHVYFGEYQNARPYAARIVRGRDDGRRWEICHRFPEGAVKHIHSIVPDPYRKRIWICTGDNDREAGLFYTDDDFESVHRYAGGDQSWRMIGLVPLPDGLVWGSDAGQDAPAETLNYIYHLDLRTGKKERLACIDKPAYYSMQLHGGGIALGTTFEPGIKRDVERSADLWFSPDGIAWEKIVSFPFQESGRTTRTKYGTLNLPLGDRSLESVFVTPENVAGSDFRLMKWTGGPGVFSERG